MVNDPVADFIIQLKNAGMVGKANVAVPYSKLKHAIADKLVAAGFITSAEQRGKGVKQELVCELRYDAGKHYIRGVQRISKPGRRLYAGVAEIHPVKFGHGKLILSTPAGILTDDEAREQNVGGEQLFKIW